MAADQSYEEDNLEMQVLTREYVRDLTDIWKRIFNREMCKSNLCKLKEHARKFYMDLVAESLERQEDIKKEIQELQEEAETLRRLLKTEVTLPCMNMENTPLLLVQSEMDKSLQELRECLRQRREQIYELLLEQEALCEELGEAPRPLLADPLPTQEEIEDFRAHLEQMKDERVARMNKLCKMRREIRNYLQILELVVTNDMEDRLLNAREVKLHQDTFTALELMHERYRSMVQEVRDGIDTIRKKLETLWDRLSASPATRNKFRKYTEYTQHTYDVFYGELQRCEQLKSQNIKLYVQQIRDEIREWWDKTLKSQAQRNCFTNFNSTCYTDDLLALHEMELDDLKTFYENNKQIFDLYDDRRVLWDRMIALEAKASEPGRYNNRGGQLLKEEKERKTIAMKLPKIEQQITELVTEYEKQENMPFLVFGENIITLMAKEWDRRKQEKELICSARKHGQTPGPKTGNSIIKRTPMSLKNATSMSSLRKTPSTISLSTVKLPISTSKKRKLAAAEKHSPMAKRSLMYALNSPSVFSKGKTNAGAGGGSGTPAASSNAKSSLFKSPMKRARVIATTIRRRSGRLSTGNKKRRSVNKTNSQKNKVPKILVNGSTDDEGVASSSEDTYDSFKNCIVPASRSSIIQANGNGAYITSTAAARTQRLREKLAAANENARSAQLPRPRIVRTPSKQNLHGASMHHHRTPPGQTAYSPSSISVLGGCSRKLTTKNLPIII